MSSFADLERSIQNNANQVDKLISLMGDLNTQSNKAKKSTEDLTKMQKKLGIAFKEDGKLFNKAKVRVNEYGQEVTKTGDVMGGFNKRSSIMAHTIAKFTKEGTTTPFLKGLSVYLQQGGNSLEYMAEYLTSSREELTIFGGEAKKMRKIFYGFFPPGMFKLFNKLSFSLQFIGGTYRKLGDSTIGASKELQKFKDILKDMDGSEEEFEGIKDIIAELEKEAHPNMFLKMLGGFKKAAGFISQPITPRMNLEGAEKQIEEYKEALKIEPDDEETQAKLEELENYVNKSKKVLKAFGKDWYKSFGGVKRSFANLFFTKGQMKRTAAREMSTLSKAIKTPYRKLQENFGLKLTGTKKQRLKDLKTALKEAKKFDISKISKVDVRQKQKDMGIGAGVDDSKVKELTKAFEELSIETAIAENKYNKLKKSHDAGNTGNWFKLGEAQRELNKLKDEEIDLADDLDIAQKQYMNNLTSVASLADAQTALIKDNKDLIVSSEAEINTIRKEGLQGYRKRLVGLKEDYAANKKAFDEGMDNQEVMDRISREIRKARLNTEELSNAFEEADKQLEIMKGLQEEGIFGIDTEQIESAMKVRLEAELKMNEAIEERAELVSNLEKEKTKSKGIKNIQTEIEQQKKFIKDQKEKIADAEKIIKATSKQIKEADKAKRAIEKDFNKGNITEDIRDSLIQQEEGKIQIAEFTAAEAETDIDTAVQDIDEGQESLDNSQEQLDTLKDLKKAGTEKLLKKFPILGKVFKFVNAFKKLLPAIGQGLRMFMMGFIYVSLAILGLLIVIKTFGPIIKEVWGNILKWLQPAFMIISAAFAMIWDGVKMVFSAFFGEGTFADAVDGLLKIAFGLLGVLLGLALAGLTLGFALLIEVGKVLWQKGVDYFLDMFTSVKKFTKGIVLIVAIVGTIVAMILGAPVWLALVIGVILWRVGSKLVDPITNIIKFIRKKVIAIIDAVKSINPFAEGGVTTKGLSLVGEKGPELVNLPKGTRVHSNRDSRNMIANSGQRGGTINNINITVNAKDTSKAEMDRIAREISRSITNNISRQSNTNNMR